MGSVSSKPIASVRKQMSESAKNRINPPRTPEWRENISKAHRGKKLSSETKAKLSKHVKSLNWTGSNNPFVRAGGHTDECKLRLSRPVYCVTNDTYYLSQKFAAEDLGIPKTHINSVCSGRRKHTHGFVFKYCTKK